jgi:hypothetical protein
MNWLLEFPCGPGAAPPRQGPVRDGSRIITQETFKFRGHDTIFMKKSSIIGVGFAPAQQPVGRPVVAVV